MVKVKHSENLSVSIKKKFEKHSSFSGVEFKKTPKIHRKSLSLSTPLTQKKGKKDKSLIEWTVTEEQLVNNLSQKIKKSTPTKLSPAEGNVALSLKNNVKKKTKAISAEHVSNDKNNIVTSLPSASKSKPKRKKIDSVKHTSNQSSNLKLNSTTKLLEADEKKDVEGKLNIVHLAKKFKIKLKDVESAVKGIIKFRAENPKLQNQLFQDAAPMFLQVCCVKIPRGHSRILRIPLPNLMLTPEDEVCLIVPEVKGIRNIEHEKHVEYYEDLLRKKGVTNIKKIMTCHELRTEYETFEQKARLVDLYDVFMVDGRISGKVVNKCGKIFYKKRKVPIPVKLYVTKLKEHIDKALSKTFFFLHLKGDSYSVQFGHDKMDVGKLVENIYSIIEFLTKQFPGGFKNIKGIQVFAARAPSIPIYFNFKNPNEVKVPKVKSRKPKAYKSYKGELTTFLDREVTVEPTGKVLVTRLGNSDNKQDDVIPNKDIINANKDDVDKGSKKRKQNEQVSTTEVVKKKKKAEENVQKDKITVNKLKKKHDVGRAGVRKELNKKNRKAKKKRHSQNEISADKIAKKKSVKVNGNLKVKENVVKIQTVKKDGILGDLKNRKVLNAKEKRSKPKKRKVHKQI